MLKRIGFVGLLVVALCLTMGVRQVRATERSVVDNIIEQAKGFDYSLGDFVYLKNEATSFVGIGIGKSFYYDWLGGKVGYLQRIKSKDAGSREWFYGGLTLNVGKGIGLLLEKLPVKVEIIDFVKENLLRVGGLGAVKPDDWESDFGLLVEVIKIRF